MSGVPSQNTSRAPGANGRLDSLAAWWARTTPATELRSATYKSGDVVVREGEPGERFYMIVEGRARASKDGQLLNEVAAPGSFGEIALLRRIPRTATITAISRVEARILAREEFLAAVIGNPESVESAETVVSTRLQAG